MPSIRQPSWDVFVGLLAVETALYVASNAAAHRVLEIDGFGGSGSAALWYCIAWLGWALLAAADLFSLLLLTRLVKTNRVSLKSMLILVGVFLCWPLELFWLHKTIFGLSAS
jgi:hypothetical protein